MIISLIEFWESRLLWGLPNGTASKFIGITIIVIFIKIFIISINIVIIVIIILEQYFFLAALPYDRSFPWLRKPTCVGGRSICHYQHPIYHQCPK